MSRFFQNHAAGGFRLDSPVKVPVASEMLRCAPPHTNEAGEEPCQGEGVAYEGRGINSPSVAAMSQALRPGPSGRVDQDQQA